MYIDVPRRDRSYEEMVAGPTANVNNEAASSPWRENRHRAWPRVADEIVGRYFHEYRR